MDGPKITIVCTACVCGQSGPRSRKPRLLPLKLQGLLGLKADGIFGVGTERAVKRYQAAHGLIADGLHLQACPFSKILDVDHAEDIRKAEEFLRGASAGSHRADIAPTA